VSDRDAPPSQPTTRQRSSIFCHTCCH
jgi:hypothetical protein